MFMFIFDIIELKQHVRAVGEYLLYMESHPTDASTCHPYIRDQLKKMYDVLQKYEKDS